MVCLSHSWYGMPGLDLFMNILFWERRDFHVSVSGRDMSRDVWNNPSGSSMVDMGIPSNIMKFPSPKCYMAFLDMMIYSDTLHWSVISLNRDVVTKLDLITAFDVITLFLEVSIEHLHMVRIAKRDAFSSGQLVLSHLSHAFILMLRPFIPELVMFTDLYSFEYPLVLLFCSWHLKFRFGVIYA